MRALPLLLLMGCAVRERAPNLHGTAHVTPAGFTFYWREATDKYRTPAAAAGAIDVAFDEWVALHPERSRAELVAIAAPYRIQLVPETHVEGNAAWRFYEGYTWYAPALLIEVAVLGSFDDKYFTKRKLSGARILVHEWEHTLRGNFHP